MTLKVCLLLLTVGETPCYCK